MFFCLSNFWPGRPIKIVGRSGMDYPISYRLVGKWRQWKIYPQYWVSEMCTRNNSIDGLSGDQLLKDYRLQHPAKHTSKQHRECC